MRKVTIAAITLLMSGSLLTLVASAVLPVQDLVTYAAYASFSGIFVMVPSSAIEQYVSKFGFHAFYKSQFKITVSDFKKLTSAEGLTALISVGFAILLWSQANFQTHLYLLPSVILGFIFATLSSIYRGNLIYKNDFHTYSVAHYSLAISQLLLPLALLQMKILAPLESLVVGQTFAWGLPLLVAAVASRDVSKNRNKDFRQIDEKLIKLIYLNGVMFLNLLIAQIIVKSNINLSKSITGAQFQIYLTYSRLATIVMLGIFTILIWNYKKLLSASATTSYFLKIIYSAVVPISLFGLYFSFFLITRVRHEISLLPIVTILNISTSSIFYAFGIILTAKAVASDRILKATVCWLSGLLPAGYMFLNSNLNARHLSEILILQSALILVLMRKITR